MFIKYLVISSFKKSLIANLLEKNNMEFEFLYEKSINYNKTITNKIVFFEDVDIIVVKKIREKNYLPRFILINSNDYVLDYKMASLCQLSAIMSFPIDKDLFFEEIIKCDNEIFKINSELFSRVNILEEKNRNLALDIEYSKNEKILLNLFLNNENVLISEDTILEHFNLFNIEISLKTLKNLLSSIRKKDKNLEIKNIYGVGYKYKKNILFAEFNSFIDMEFEKNIKSSKNFELNIEISCSYLLNKLDIDRVCFMEYEDDRVKILDEKVVYPQKKVLEQISFLEITTFHKKTIDYSLKKGEPYIINFDDIVNLYFYFLKVLKEKLKQNQLYISLLSIKIDFFQ